SSERGVGTQLCHGVPGERAVEVGRVGLFLADGREQSHRAAEGGTDGDGLLGTRGAACSGQASSFPSSPTQWRRCYQWSPAQSASEATNRPLGSRSTRRSVRIVCIRIGAG